MAFFGHCNEVQLAANAISWKLFLPSTDINDYIEIARDIYNSIEFKLQFSKLNVFFGLVTAVLVKTVFFGWGLPSYF